MKTRRMIIVCMVVIAAMVCLAPHLSSACMKYTALKNVRQCAEKQGLKDFLKAKASTVCDGRIQVDFLAEEGEGKTNLMPYFATVLPSGKIKDGCVWAGY